MSTTVSIRYQKQEGTLPAWHLYEEAFEREDTVYLELEGVQANITMIDDIWAKAGTVLLPLPADCTSVGPGADDMEKGRIIVR